MLIGNTLKEVVKKANPKFDIVTELFGENIVITKNSPYYKILKNQPVLTCWYSPAKNISDITPRKALGLRGLAPHIRKKV